ncbi:MAG: hypothetical protein J5726_01645 [Treponema sp.]|nr:hypothetical protein [Treponema sp.]
MNTDNSQQNNLEAFLESLEKADWHDICNSIVYVRCPEKMEVLRKAGFAVDPRNDGVLALCFIDHGEGLSFYVIAAAHIRADNIFVSKENKAACVILRAASIPTALCLKSDFINADVNTYEAYVSQIVKQYEYGLDDAIKMRNITELDGFRKPFFPDDIEVLLLAKGLEQERVFVRACKYGEGCLYGQLLDEPDQDFGVHKDEVIDFMVLDREGTLSTVHLKK